MGKKVKERDFNILLNIKNEIYLNTKVIKSKKKYTRKKKYKTDYFKYE